MARSDEHNPLTKEHLETLNQVLVMAPATQNLLDKLRNSGINVDQAQLENDAARDLATALKRNFFPAEQ